MTHLTKPIIWLSGYIPDLPTPFDENGELDLAAFARLCQRQIEAEVSAIVVGESRINPTRRCGSGIAASSTKLAL